MNIRTVKLELLRPGPPHNQLLSPLTEYIALCGDAPPESVRVPFEHYRILRQLQGLRPGRSPAEIEGTITELREDVLRLLCGIRCLATSLAEAHGDGAEVIELELVLSASELSLIPFELAFIPGSPTRELAHREVIVMRRSRRVPRARLHWRRRPRVLVLAASPPGFRAVPLPSHVQGIREAIGPWLTHIDGQRDNDLILDELKKFVVVVPNASELSIQETIRRAVDEDHPFTHVHLLAHGDEIAQDDGPSAEPGALREPRFGIVLHDSRMPTKRDTLSGRRLFSALAGSDERCRRQLPQFLTLASCDSGNIGGVVVPGASVAHDVHDGGIPVVVASQFPLSFPGSTVFVKRMYERLLAGDDPRCALRETRRSVHAAGKRGSGPLDWAAIVQYGALPENLAAKVKEARIRALRQRVDAAISSVDPTVVPSASGTLASAWKHATDALDQLAQMREDPDVDRYIARANLRWAFLLPAVPSETSAEKVKAPVDGHCLSTSRPLCIRWFRDGLRRHWRMTQNPISLVESLLGDFFLGEPLAPWYVVAAVTECAEAYSEHKSKEKRRKLERSLMELWVLEPVVPDLGVTNELREVMLAATARFWNGAAWFELIYDRHFSEAPPTDFEYYSARQQLHRIIEAATALNQASREPPGQVQRASRQRRRNARSKAAPKKDPLTEVLERARAIDEFLARRGAPRKFSAVVDWIDDPDGGRRTVGT